MGLYLRLRHWQLFIIFLFVIVVAQVLFGFLSTALIGAVLFGWLWSISLSASRRLPKELSASPAIMGIGLIYALAYSWFSFDLFHGFVFPWYGVVLHILAVVAVFYALGFSAKQLTKMMYRRQVTFVEYLGPLLLLWFFPIGVWFIQPRVNELLTEKNA